MKNRFTTVIMILLALDILFCAGCCIYTLIVGGSGAQWLPAVTSLAALIACAHYAFLGYKKSAAPAFKAMLLCCALASLMCLVPLAYDTEAIANWQFGVALCSVVYALCFGAYLILALVPNLGKVKSDALIGFTFAAHLAVYIFLRINQPAAGDSIFSTMRAMRHHCMFLLALVVLICNYFKYRDKAARGSK